ncbi:IKS protein kinase [Thecamonas trahens ATCC 50062]|uniref:IKS protein kinase n=1 Tax=Thecamonas trahens ATCC 50062 TaxID=461836 RepID=A0A0L0D837_THETB|nr:IKS protein kinase [Thecamonas trahens ATCC 50062]KNC48380.1 IKS protein kinase [Thecamonas trahens ATCC 50062]|eukprot:XP_013758497.1 IKS protein kinase [Thecamonas trahens ATCC 50062]
MNDSEEMMEESIGGGIRNGGGVHVLESDEIAMMDNDSEASGGLGQMVMATPAGGDEARNHRASGEIQLMIPRNRARAGSGRLGRQGGTGSDVGQSPVAGDMLAPLGTGTTPQLESFPLMPIPSPQLRQDLSGCCPMCGQQAGGSVGGLAGACGADFRVEHMDNDSDAETVSEAADNDADVVLAWMASAESLQMLQPPRLAESHFRILAGAHSVSDGDESGEDDEAAEEVETAGSRRRRQSVRLADQAFATGYYRRFFQELGKIGSGFAGGVYLCQHHLDACDLGLYALKKIPVGTATALLEATLEEVRILRRLQHPNVIHFKHVWLEMAENPADFGPPLPCLFVLMQFANAGNLAELLGLNAAPPTPAEQAAARRAAARGMSAPDAGMELPLSVVWAMLRDVLSGLAYLHDNGIVHCDIKPENILVHEYLADDLEASRRSRFQRDTAHLRLLLTDFGQSRMLSDAHVRSGNTGTLRYTAPELLAHAEAGSRFAHLQTYASDVWALGITFYQMVTRQSPYDERRELGDQIQALPSAPRGAWPPTTGQADVDAVLAKMLALHPRERSSSAALLAAITARLGSDAPQISRAIIPYAVRRRQVVIAQRRARVGRDVALASALPALTFPRLALPPAGNADADGVEDEGASARHGSPVLGPHESAPDARHGDGVSWTTMGSVAVVAFAVGWSVGQTMS